MQISELKYPKIELTAEEIEFLKGVKECIKSEQGSSLLCNRISSYSWDKFGGITGLARQVKDKIQKSIMPFMYLDHWLKGENPSFGPHIDGIGDKVEFYEFQKSLRFMWIDKLIEENENATENK